MVNWLASMQRTYEYYVVDPGTWRDVKRLNTVKSCTINRDSTVETLGSATIDVTELVGECYIRVYMIAIQKGIRYKKPLGTFLVQTPSTSFDGKMRSMSLDAYTPLLELKENPPPLGYSLFKGDNILEKAYLLTREHARAPVVMTRCDDTLSNDFVSNVNDTWITFISDLILNAKYLFDLDEMGRILFSPKQDTASLQPVWTYDDGNSSILYPDITMDHDLYGIPNIVEVIYSSGSETYRGRAVNDDPNSPTSTVRRGRPITHVDPNPSFSGPPTELQVQEYAERLLREMSSVECTISYSHGYCPVRVGDCVRLNYSRADLTDIKAKVISQSIPCTPECQVTEKAVFTKRLWR